MAKKLVAKGGNGGMVWDDSADHGDVAKIHVRGGPGGIQFIKFDYNKNGQITNGSMHGLSGKGFTQTFIIDLQSDEYLQVVEGYYDEATGVIHGLQFQTNLNISELMGDDSGTKLSVGDPRKKIIGFHGFAETHLKSIGAYVSNMFIKLPYQDGPGGAIWDNGGIYDGIVNVYVSYDKNCVRALKFDFDKGGQMETQEHGNKYDGQQTTEKFVVDYPNDYVTSVGATLEKFDGYGIVIVRSLTFKTAKGITSPTYGPHIGRKYVMEKNGFAIVGFHGRVGAAIDIIGAYCGLPPPPPPPPAEKLQGQGGEGGVPWNDGVFNCVRKIYVGQGESCIACVKFVYDKNSLVVEGDNHGKKTLLGYEEFELEYPSEYITAVEGCHDKIYGSDGAVITMLRFKTNKRTSPPFGLESASSFVIGKEGYKIVGFHGNAGDELDQLGVHIIPISQ